MGKRLSVLSKVSVTSAMFCGGRDPDPLKTTSNIKLDRSDLADISPKHQRTASMMLDFPQPLGPTIAVMPGSKSSLMVSAKDLKPIMSRRFKCIGEVLLALYLVVLG